MWAFTVVLFYQFHNWKVFTVPLTVIMHNMTKGFALWHKNFLNDEPGWPIFNIAFEMPPKTQNKNSQGCKFSIKITSPPK